MLAGSSGLQLQTMHMHANTFILGYWHQFSSYFEKNCQKTGEYDNTSWWSWASTAAMTWPLAEGPPALWWPVSTRECPGMCVYGRVELVEYLSKMLHDTVSSFVLIGWFSERAEDGLLRCVLQHKGQEILDGLKSVLSGCSFGLMPDSTRNQFRPPSTHQILPSGQTCPQIYLIPKLYKSAQ